MYQPVSSIFEPTPYVSPSGKTIGSSGTSAGKFADTLTKALSSAPTPQRISENSPLVIMVPAGASAFASGSYFSPSGATSDYTPSLDSPLTWGPSGTYSPQPTDPTAEYDYSYEKVGQIDRAPMAMFEHNGELVLSAITRNGIDETPIWSYSEEDGVQQRSVLPEAAESGNYGYSTGSGLHLTPESWGGAVDWTASSPDGPWTKHDYSQYVPHEYSNLKWGYSYQDPVTGRQFLGFGNADHPGMVMSYDSGQWEVFAAPDDMRFPTGIGVVSSGDNAGTVLIASSYGGTNVHAVAPDGTITKVKSTSDWGTLKVDNDNQLAYLTSQDSGKVYYASFDDLDNWQEVRYVKPSGEVDHIETLGDPCVHPKTGRMIFPAMDQDGGNTALYEARVENGEVTLNEVAYISGAGEWTAKTAVVGDELYLATGMATGKDADATPGAIYRIDVS